MNSQNNLGSHPRMESCQKLASNTKLESIDTTGLHEQSGFLHKLNRSRNNSKLSFDSPNPALNSTVVNTRHGVMAQKTTNQPGIFILSGGGALQNFRGSLQEQSPVKGSIEPGSNTQPDEVDIRRNSLPIGVAKANLTNYQAL